MASPLPRRRIDMYGNICDQSDKLEFDKTLFFAQQHFLKTGIPQCLGYRWNIRRPQFRKYNPVKIAVLLIPRTQSGCLKSFKHVHRISRDPESAYLKTVELGASSRRDAALDYGRGRGIDGRYPCGCNGRRLGCYNRRTRLLGRWRRLHNSWRGRHDDRRCYRRDSRA